MPIDLKTLAPRMERAAPHLFLILFLVTGLFLAWNLPPFQGADELAHFDRADFGALGHVVGEKRPIHGHIGAGGVLESGIVPAARVFGGVPFHPEVKVETYQFRLAFAWGWDTEPTERDFRASAAYPPMFYLPASAAIVAGKALHRPIVQTLYMARMAQTLACALVGWLALLAAGRSRLWLYAILMLPMSTALAASVTTDGLLIATTALGAALICRPMGEGRPMRGREVALAAVCFAAVGMTKAPYALFGLAFLAAETERPRWRWIAAGAVLAASFAWTAWTTAFVQLPLTRADVALDPGGQVRWLLGHPLAIPGLATRTLAANWKAYADAFVGVLGWLDTPLPTGFYPIAQIMLGLALAASLAVGRDRSWRAQPWAATVIALAVFGAIHLALYVLWTGVGAPVIEGVAGRYFLPLAAFMALAVEGRRPVLPEQGPAAGLRVALTGLVLVFPLISLALVERAVILRYYLQ